MRRSRPPLAALGAFLLAGCALSPGLSPPAPEPGDAFDEPRAEPGIHDLEAATGRLAEARAQIEAGDIPRALFLIEFVMLEAAAQSKDSKPWARLKDAASAQWLALVRFPLPEGDPIEALRPPVDPWWTSEDLARPEVLAWKKHYAGRDARTLATSVERAVPHLDQVLDILREEGIPQSLWVLALVESGGKSEAQSGRGAVGPWQIVPDTGKHLGLLMTHDRDERRDWAASTRAACRYLRELYEELPNGLLALAAFNCGPGRVRREMERAGSDNYWNLSLPRETDRHVPRVLALADIAGPDLQALARQFPSEQFDMISLPYPVFVRDLARASGAEEAWLRSFNPSWLREATPGDGHPVTARVPGGTGARLETMLAAAEIPKATAGVSGRKTHRVAAGDTLWGIAKRYGFRLEDVLSVNGFSSREIIRPGQKVRLP